MGARNPPNEDDTVGAATPLTPLGDFMRRRNVELGLSVAAVAQRVGMSRATWYRIARGECVSPGMRVLRGLARVYKVAAADLLALALDTPAEAPVAGTPAPAPEVGDALWRIRHPKRVLAGSGVELRLDLQNLSGQPWRHAVIRAAHSRWLPLGNDHGPALHSLAADPLACCATLTPSLPGDWARAHMLLQAPPVAGRFACCLGLHTTPSAAAGLGVALWLEVE